MSTRGDEGVDGHCADAELFQQRFVLLAEMSSDGICVHRDGQIVFANAAAVRWMGVDPAVGLIGRRVADFVHADSLPDVQRRLDGLHRDGDSAPPTEVVMGRPQKSARDVQATSTRVDWDGRPAVVTNFRDLTTVKTAVALKYEAALLDYVSDAVIGISPTGTVTSWNAAAQSIYRRGAECAVGLPVDDAVGADLDPGRVVEGGGVQDTTHIAADGTPLSVRISVASTANGYVVLCADLTALRRAERHFTAVVTAMDAGVIVFNADGSIESANPTARRIVAGIGTSTAGFAADVDLVDADGRPLPAHRYPLRQTVESGLPQIDRILGLDVADRRRVWLSLSTRLLSPGHPEHSPVLCTFVDVTAQKVASEQLVRAAHHDTLTGLPNRSNAMARMIELLTPGAERRLGAVLFIDMDTLKQINDSYGHGAGDAVLTTTATRMGDALRDCDVLARLAGDEFVVLLVGPVDRPEIDRLVAALHRAAVTPIRYRDADIHVTASIGVAVIEAGDSRDALELLGAADDAMYAAKASGPGCTRYAMLTRPDGPETAPHLGEQARGCGGGGGI